ncbi:hypothetical protein L210DRAFT_873515, partial [Boletus edulis BED1]
KLTSTRKLLVQRIDRINVDEAHNIHMAGLSHHGEPAFRPAYGKLGLLRPLLSKGVPIQALSATLPDHVLTTSKLNLVSLPTFWNSVLARTARI